MPDGTDGNDGKRIRVSVDGVRLVLILPPQAPPPDPAESPPMWHSEWLVFSDLERDILILLIDEGGQTKREIAAALGRPPEGLVGDVLTNLAAKLILISSHEGYRLNLPAAKRPALRAWLAARGDPGSGPGQG